MGDASRFVAEVGMIRILIVAVAWFLAGVPLVSAKLIPHVITFNATTVNIDPDCAINRSFGYHTFPCDAKPGDSFFGFFTVEENLLTQEGVNLPGILGDFVVRIGDVIWDINSPSDFDGFRGPTLPGGGIPGCALCYEFDALSPGFNVVGGKIVGIWGGVYSDGDEPFVDFEYIFGPGGWGSVDAYRNLVLGNYTITAVVSEPSSLLTLLLCGMAILWFVPRLGCSYCAQR
jgi:hypothetical protein